MKRSNINLLVCLNALLATRSVTRAAERLEMSQSGMSNALSRLRELTGDPLLVRSGNEFNLTERAQSIALKVRYGIELMDEIFANEGPLDLLETKATVTLAAADNIGLNYLPTLSHLLSDMAPGLVLNVRAPDPDHVKEWLSEGECDIAIGYFPEVHPDLRRISLYSQPMSCITARGSCPDLTLDTYIERPHVVFGSPFSPRSTLEQTLIHELKAIGHDRIRSVRVSSLLLIPYIVASSHHVATLPTWICERFSAHLPLDIWPVPFALADIETVMVWHERTHRLPLFVWLRELIRSIPPPPLTHQARDPGRSVLS
ncbi:LysR family transcriptional regulator [Hydrogenophaga palleronii]|uniref:LysR family transcriptional regulator n=1 Tax=Hydrogenophaga palleronii TaxID=65655 RepID=UPI0008243E4D|nr:LysR family transcriptional regulator [Hydrogenophaga palleronii]